MYGAADLLFSPTNLCVFPKTTSAVLRFSANADSVLKVRLGKWSGMENSSKSVASLCVHPLPSLPLSYSKTKFNPDFPFCATDVWPTWTNKYEIEFEQFCQTKSLFKVQNLVLFL